VGRIDILGKPPKNKTMAGGNLQKEIAKMEASLVD
jgi:hypothetical protein